MTSHSPLAACDICGRRRSVKRQRTTGRCRDCMKRIPEPTQNEALTGGYWRTDKRGIQRWIPADPPTPHPFNHASFNRHKANGERPCDDCYDAERDYQRDRKRAQRQRKEAA